MKKISGLLIILFLLVANVYLYSAPVDLPSAVKGDKGLFSQDENQKNVFRGHYEAVEDWLDAISASLSVEYEDVQERKFDRADGEMEGKIYKGKATVSFGGKLDLYAFGGQTNDFQYHANIQNSDIIFNLDDEIIWGGGLNAVLYEWEDSAVKLFIDGKYRQMEDADYSSVIVNGTTFNKDQLTAPTTDAKYREWQGALGLSAKIGYFTPYFGVTYSEIKAKAEATAGGTTYALGTAKSDTNVGPFCGISLAPTKGISLEGQARFLNEQSFSGSATIRF